MQYKRGTFTANASQSAAITHKLAPLMIIAGAGTGKTTTLLHRIYYLIEHYNLNPENVLTITYTEKAADELKTRIVNNIGDTANAMTISTFHAFCYDIVKENQQPTNFAPILMDEGDAIYLFLKNFDKLGPFESRSFVVDPIKSITQSFIPFINRLRDELIDPRKKANPVINDDIITEETIAQLSDLKRIYPLFQKWKKEQNFVDFGDMILNCYDLLRTNKSVLNQIQNQYKYIVIDEFQDNNFALNEVVKQIVGKSGHITVVGDEDQVVYSFRGASKYNVTAFRNNYKNHNNYAEITLKENFRSTQEILNVANNSISNAKNREQKHLIARDNKTGEKPHLFHGENKFHPAVISKIIKELSDKHDYLDMAILCRTKSQVKSISVHLTQENIPIRTYLVNFFEIPEIKNLLAWCSLIAETQYQDSGLFRILSTTVNENIANGIFRNFSKRDHTLRFDLIQNTKNNKIRNIVNQVLRLRKLNQKKNASEIVWEICVLSKVLRPLLTGYEWKDQLALLNLGQFINRSIGFTARHKNDNSLRSFVYYMNVLQESNGIQTIYPTEKHNSQTVLVSTIHGVKGGEYPIIFMPFNRSASFPLNFKKSDLIERPPEKWLSSFAESQLSLKEQHIEEERRLFYVGLTRAKDTLYLFAPTKATSVFIKELNKDLLKVSNMENDTITNKQENYSTLRNKYEKRLANALNQNQFSLSKNFLNAIENINQIEKGETVNWGNSTWEVELKSHLKKPLEIEPLEQLNLSASSIETYEQCPLKYRLSNIDKIPQVSSKPQMTFGNIVHRVLEQFHHPNNEQTQERIIKLLDANWESLGFNYEAQEADFKRQGVELLIKYCDHLSKNPVHVVEREFQFSFKIEDIIINGKIDRIDKSKKGYNVIDYKTSKQATKANKNIQLAIYSMYLQQEKQLEFGGLPESTTLYFLREEEPLRVHQFTATELMEMSEKILEIGKNIRNQKFVSCKGFYCDWCDYKNLLCPEWEEK
ncbi:MAG: ATP-dependent DNA helicase [Candidatus Neomarinimicrobiota bacterium]